MPTYFVGVDLTDLTKPQPRPVDVAVLDESLNCLFRQWHYNGSLDGIIPDVVEGSPFVMAIDGPQGLAGSVDAGMRVAERKLGTQAKSTYELPNSGPFKGYVKGSVILFKQLAAHNAAFLLCGLDGANHFDATLIEVYPGHTWNQLSRQRLPKKKLLVGREARLKIIQPLGITMADTKLPNHDQLDAAIAAWTAYRFAQGKAVLHGCPPTLDQIADVIREGYIVEPL